ncbi:MAG TPA: radical SAM protein [Burkholderiales bacterium]|nr:radical SAM protein [Burkholderiales bacterium]
MTRHEIADFEPERCSDSRPTAIERAREAMARAGCWNMNQPMGRRWPIGCVALEITQRCNLDCTLCYLSDNSEAVRDLPIDEVLRRVELIHRHYGSNTDVQITGGDPTLRKRDELIAIVRKVRSLDMRATLMTNGIRATRPLLESLASAGLMDVAFHVDTTQRRKGYATEVELNEVRQQYLERARGLPLSVFFNTTVHRGNFHEIPDLVRFFKGHAGAVRTASFQLAADTGRGVDRTRGAAITPESVARQIESGAGTSINFQASLVGHFACNRYGMCLETNGALYDALDDTAFVGRMLSATSGVELHRSNTRGVVRSFLLWLALNPQYLLPVLAWTGRKAWSIRKSLIAGRGKVRTLSFVIHNFMDSHALERDRIDACVFKVMTADGPISMCMHNAKRDSFILKPISIHSPSGTRYWQPLTGKSTSDGDTPIPGELREHALKRLKGHARNRCLQRDALHNQR